MVKADFVLQLIENINNNDEASIEDTVLQIVRDEKSKGNSIIANKIRLSLQKDIKFHELSPSSTHILADIPIDSHSGNPLFSVHPPISTINDIALSEALSASFNDIKCEIENRQQLRQWGFNINTKILLCGPPGTGKTLFAQVMAGELGYQLIDVRLDSIISSYLGETSSNIRNIFDYVQKNKVVLFIDEFDAISKLRDDTKELGELKRVVNSLIQNIDGLTGDSVFIAATNHPHMLDSAIWRRFDHVLWFENPNQQQRLKILELTSRHVPLRDVSLEEIAELTSGMSGSDVAAIVRATARNALLNSRNFINQSDFIFAIGQMDKINFIKKKIFYPNDDLDVDIPEKARMLRNKGQTYSQIARELNIGQSTAWKYVNKG